MRGNASIDRIAEGLARWAGSGALIIDHLVRSSAGASSEVDTTEVLTTVLSHTLAPIAERHAADELSTAAHVLADAVETLAGEILLMEPVSARQAPTCRNIQRPC